MQKIIRLSVVGLSAAAAIILIISLYLSVPVNIKVTSTQEALVIPPKNDTQKSLQDNSVLKITGQVKNVKQVIKKNKRTEAVITDNKPVITADLLPENKTDSLSEIKKSVINIEKIQAGVYSGISPRTDNYSLTASTVVFNEALAEVDDGRSKIGKYIAKTFREKILKEKTPHDTPLKGYEIAEAGVTGINKLFGWEMALDKKNDENGNLKSVYFSSRMLKFNAPVKKSEPLP